MSKPLRRDAARNREKVLTAAAGVFAEQGLHGSLEEVARRAGVGIGTVYNHFRTRDALIEALLPARLAAIDELASAAEAEPDDWRAFTDFARRLLQQMAGDRGLLEAFTDAHPYAEQVAAACHRAMTQLSRLVDRVHTASALRADASDADIVHLIWAMALLGDAAGISTATRCLDLTLDGLRTARR